MALTKEKKLDMLRKMMLGRAFEEMAEQSYMLGKIHGTMHLSMGMEASAVGAIAALKEDDYILGTHRGHTQVIAYGADVNRMMSEFFGKENGYCRGRGWFNAHRRSRKVVSWALMVLLQVEFPWQLAWG